MNYEFKTNEMRKNEKNKELELTFDIRNFLNSDIQPRYNNFRNYYETYDFPMTFFEVIVTSFSIGFSNFGTLSDKHEIIFKYYVLKRKLISETTYFNIYSLSSMIPAATIVQLIGSIIIIKTKNYFYSFFGTLFFILPGIIFCSFLGFLLEIYLKDFLNYSEKVSYIEIGFEQCALGLILDYLIEQSLKISNSTFQIGLIVISTIIMLISNNFFTIIIALLIFGFLSMRNRESEFLLEKANSDIINSINEINSFYYYFNILLYFGIGIFLYVFYKNYLYFKLYIIGSSVFVDYSVINYFQSLFFKEKNFKNDNLLLSFGIMSLCQGQSFNMINIIMIKEGIFVLLKTIGFIYLPSFFFGFLGINSINYLNENPDIQFFLKGIKTSSIGFVVALIPNLFWECCIKNEKYNFIFGILIILNGLFWFRKQKFWIGYISCILCSFIISFF